MMSARSRRLDPSASSAAVTRFAYLVLLGSVFASAMATTSRGQSPVGGNASSVENLYRQMVEAERNAYSQRSGLQPPPSATNRAAASGAVATAVPSTQSSSSWFVDSLTTFRTQVRQLITASNRFWATSPQLREVLGSLYQLDSDSESLITRTRAGEASETILASYEQLDMRWRDVSYRLRASGNNDPSIAALVEALDETCRQIDRRLGLSAPIDRVRLRDLMIVTLTYMDAMFDDIRLNQGYSAQADTLLRDGRLLRERLRQESYRMDRADYNEIVASFTEFARQWRLYAAQLYTLNDAHVNQRLDSIRRQGDEVYAALRIPAATDRGQVQLAARRLTTSLTTLWEQLSRWGVNRLPADQARFVETVRSLAEQSGRLETELARGQITATATSLFVAMDRSWTDGLRSMRTLDARSGAQGLLAPVDATFGELRDVLGGGSTRSETELLRLAASLETAADDLNNDLQRYKRYLSPVSFANTIGASGDAIYNASRELHRQVADRASARDLSRTASVLVQQFEAVTPLLGELNQRGLAANRVERVHDVYRQLQPLVAQTAAMLLN